MENCLLTRCSQYKEAWRKQIPQMWEFACRDCPDLLEDCPEEGMEVMDDGKLTKTNRTLYVFLSQEGMSYMYVEVFIKQCSYARWSLASIGIVSQCRFC